MFTKFIRRDNNLFKGAVRCPVWQRKDFTLKTERNDLSCNIIYLYLLAPDSNCRALVLVELMYFDLSR